MNGYWILSSAFSEPIKMIMWLLSLGLLMQCIRLIDLHMLNHLCNPGWIQLHCGIWSFLCIVGLGLLIFCWGFFFLFFWLCRIFFAACEFSLVAESGGFSSLWCTGFSLQWLLLEWSTGSRHPDSSSCSMWAQGLWCVGSRVHGLQQLWHKISVVSDHGP